MFGRLCAKADIERALAQVPCSRSTHFVLHHLKASAAMLDAAASNHIVKDLSTESVTGSTGPVDDGSRMRFLGALVPKRHARRAVTRNMLKRQIRSVAQRHEDQLAPGHWLVRLRAPYARAQFAAAASLSLRAAARAELEQLFLQVRR